MLLAEAAAVVAGPVVLSVRVVDGAEDLVAVLVVELEFPVWIVDVPSLAAVVTMPVTDAVRMLLMETP